MFVYREAFLLDHLQHAYNGKYWSPPLLYTLCALGATMSPDQDVKKRGEELVLKSQEMLFGYGLEQPHITFVQALLCLAFYHIGQGNYSKGWSVSGMAFRMGQDLGFQQDPMHWISLDGTLATPQDLEIRRRIYWGCYNSDKSVDSSVPKPANVC